MKNYPLYKQIQEYIKERIRTGELRPGDRIPSEKELAEQFHVSQITSKNAVIKLADEGVLVRHQGKGTFVNQDVLKQIPINHSSKIMEKQNNGVIGLIIPTLITKVEQKIVNNIERFVSMQGYQLMLRISRESQSNESEAIESFIMNGVKGMIIFPTEEEAYNEDILRLSLNKFPLVLIDRFFKEIRTYSVSSDNIKGTFNAVTYMLEQGHKNIALITPKITNTVTEHRASGFEMAFSQKALPINKSLWCELDINDVRNQKGEDIIYNFIQARPEITAAFVMNAELTHYSYKALTKLGKSIPDEFTLFGFDDPGCLEIPYVKQDEEEMSKLAVGCLLEQIEGTFHPLHVVVPVNLII